MLNFNQKTLFYFPTTVMLVDDDNGFLSNLSLNLNKSIPFELFEKPKLAIEAVKKRNEDFSLTNIIKESIYEDNKIFPNEEDIHLNLRKMSLYRMLFERRRFSPISTILVDYSMPEMNGGEFCRKINNKNIQKIMLTGNAEYQTAVDLFNEGLIDKFIVKDSSNMLDQINQSIVKAQFCYLSYISTEIEKLVPFLNNFEVDPLIDKFIKNYFHDNSFYEYYMLDKFGSSLFLDEFGKATWCIFSTPDKQELYYDIAREHDAPIEIINSLESREKIPFFLTIEDDKIPVQQWNDFLHPAKELANGIYYACFTEVGKYNLDEKQIFSYDRYIKNL